MTLLLALAIFEPAEVSDLRSVLEAMHSLVGVVETQWAGTSVDRASAAARMKALTLAIHDANDGLAYIANAKTSGSTRASTVSFGLKRIREHAVARIDDALAFGAPVQTQRDALAAVQTLPYSTWRPSLYPAVFEGDGDFPAFNLAAMKASEAMWNLYWDAVNYAAPGVSPLWSAEAAAECGQSVRQIRDMGRAMVRARAIALGVPIQGDVGTRDELLGLLLTEIVGYWPDNLQIAEFGKNGCIGTLADLNGGEWVREQINWRAPKAIGDSSTDNRAAEWFSDFLWLGDVGPWVQAALIPSGGVVVPPTQCPAYAVEFLSVSPSGQIGATCVELRQ